MTQQTFNQRLEDAARKKLDAGIQGIKDTMGAGLLKDHGEYKYQAGILNGLDKAKQLLADALAECQKN